MLKLQIVQGSALLTAGQAVTLQAVDGDNHEVNVSWSLTPDLGTLVKALPPPGAGQEQGSSSATYVAPSIVQAAQSVAVTAISVSETASVTIAISPDAITIVPQTVVLHSKQTQKFVAIVAGDGEKPTWVLTPQVGTMDENGMYTAPDSIPDDGTLAVTAVSMRLGKQTSAKVTLSPEPWHGIGPVLLGCYLFLVFSVVYLMIGLWPSEIMNIDALKTEQAEAQSNFEKSNTALQAAQVAAGDHGAGTAPAPPDAARQQALVDQATKDLSKAQDALDQATEKLNRATSPSVETKMVKQLNREIDLLCLVLLAGALGSFLHMAQSFSDFAGNRRLKSSWVWWYCFLPFVGGGLALVFYAGLRGGLITVGAAPGVKATDLNPYGLVAASALAGMFSKAATKKLGEVFDTFFQSSKGAQTADPLKPDSGGTGQPSKPSATGSSAAPGGTKPDANA